MKPSELIKSYILSKQLPKQQNELSKYFECCFERLDNNFIDREELKDKINKVIENFKNDNKIIYPYKYNIPNYIANDYEINELHINILKKILELIDK